MGERVDVDIIVKAIGKGFGAVISDQRKMREESDKQKTAVDKVKDAWIATAAGVTSVIGVYRTLKGLWSFAEQGAEIKQTAESFDFLLDKVGASADTLEQLRNASRGTVNDMTLMSSTMTVAAGASDNLASALIENSPQLMEIAKAANKLNPTLGDTAYMYDSLARGIKRSSPLILDNLGVVVKVGEANEIWAAKIGKTVDQLTAEDKQMALLNAVLKTGGTLVEQVGGETASAVDRFKQLEVVIDNVKNQIKELVSDALGPFLDVIIEDFERSRDFKESLEYLGISAEEARGRLDGLIYSEEEVQLATIAAAQAQQDMAASFERMHDAADPAMAALEGVGDEAADTRSELEKLGDAGAQAPRDVAQGFHDLLTDLEAGGPEIRAAIEEMYSQAAAGIITREEADKATAELLLSYESRKAEIEGKPFNLYKTAKNIHDDLNVPLEDVYSYWESMKRDIEAGISTTLRVNIIKTSAHYSSGAGSGGGYSGDYVAAPPGYSGTAFGSSSGGPGGQHGLDMIIPPGFPNDSYPIRGTSGERVTITPQGQGGGDSSDILNELIRVLQNLPERVGEEVMAGIAEGDWR